MFNLIAIAIIVLDLWGMVGIWTTAFGFHNAWELWVSRTSNGKSLLFNSSLTLPLERYIKYTTASSSAPGTATRKS